ncbi:hypothetical protein NI389_13635 [Pseudoalteromonas xiamenensis]|uniref:hypothetical protein n=1 Tax=Pseudoalteromonas xiamenensis TaxID=882626 RepID=UPI0027E5AC95|nr:hypothetical protein [Pseudoalteromonas xiamenensis]WMN59246.1 hypothetical protein NI389_13635 [Pseudoalteromonas xiamenensis]
MPEWYIQILKMTNNSWLLFLAPAVVFYVLRKDRPAFLFALITATFFVIGAVLHDSIKEFDRGIYVYRYLFWAAMDIGWMGTIAYLALKDKVYMWQSIIGQLVVVVAPVLQLFRLLDRHLWDLHFSNYLYTTLLPLVNVVTLVVCYLPILFLFKRSKTTGPVVRV